jgi:LacI family transcriptional regulator
MAHERVPIVLVNAQQPSLWSVAVDHDAAAAQAVTYCVGIGHRRIALVDRPADPFASEGPGVCQRGYRAALAAAQISVPAGYEQMVELDARGGAAALDGLVALQEMPTAVVVASDTQAIGVLESARARGIDVPRELSVVGYNDNEFAEYLGLTTVQVPLRALGREAARMLLMIQSDPHAAPTTTYLSSQLVVRGTCAPPRE